MQRLYIFLSVLIAVCAFQKTAQSETITIANGEWPPFASPTMKQGGFITHIVTRAFAHSGIKVKYRYLPWRRSLEDTKIGKYAATPLWRKTSEREKVFLYSDLLIDLRTSFFHRADVTLPWDGTAESLASLEVGGMAGYQYGVLTEWAEQGKVYLLKTTDIHANYRMLSVGRIPVLVENNRVAHHLIDELGLTNQLVEHPINLGSEPHYLITPKALKESAIRLKAFNSGMKYMKKSGELNRIVLRTH